MIVYPKEIVIATLRDYFSNDSFYHYVKDEWGFPKIPEQKDLELDAGVNDNISTRVFIGESFKHDGIFYPAILVKHNSARYVPVSFNRESGGIQYDARIYEDGYGNQKVMKFPKSMISAGAWEGSMSVDILSRSMRARDDLAELIAMCFTDLYFDDLVDVGLVIKPVNVSGSSESEDRNDKLFRTSINLDFRTEWRREIPISNLIERILFTIDFQNLESDRSVPAVNMRVYTDVRIEDLYDIVDPVPYGPQPSPIPGSSSEPTVGDTLIWNGINWVPGDIINIPLCINITSFNGPGIKEIGEQVFTPNFTATYSFSPTSVKLQDSVNLIDTNLATYFNFNSPYNFVKYNNGEYVTFILKAYLGVMPTTASRNIVWGMRIYWGETSSTGPYSETEIKALDSSRIQTVRQGTFTSTPSPTQYILIGIPAEFGNPTFYVDVWEGGFTLVQSNLSITNAYGVTKLYNIYRSDQLNLGETSFRVA